MLLYQIFKIIFIFGIILAFIQLVFFFRVKSTVRGFEHGMTEEQVKDFTKLVRKMIILNHPELWNTLRAGFTLVNNAENISYEAKKELMNAMLSKGVSLGNVRINKSNKFSQS